MQQTAVLSLLSSPIINGLSVPPPFLSPSFESPSFATLAIFLPLFLQVPKALLPSLPPPFAPSWFWLLVRCLFYFSFPSPPQPVSILARLFYSLLCSFRRRDTNFVKWRRRRRRRRRSKTLSSGERRREEDNKEGGHDLLPLLLVSKPRRRKAARKRRRGRTNGSEAVLFSSPLRKAKREEESL